MLSEIESVSFPKLCINTYILNKLCFCLWFGFCTILLYLLLTLNPRITLCVTWVLVIDPSCVQGKCPTHYCSFPRRKNLACIIHYSNTILKYTLTTFKTTIIFESHLAVFRDHSLEGLGSIWDSWVDHVQRHCPIRCTVSSAPIFIFEVMVMGPVSCILHNYIFLLFWDYA